MSKVNNLVTPFNIFSAVSICLVSFFVIKYPDRAIFEKLPEGIPNIKGYPLIGTLFQQIAEKDDFYEAQQQHFEKLGTMTMSTSSVLIPLTIMTIDPKNIEYIAKKNHANYIKSDHFRNSAKSFFGTSGIFTVKGDYWKRLRKTTHQVLTVKKIDNNFDFAITENFKASVYGILDQYALNKTVFDIQDLMLKFTFDIFVKIGFGQDLHILTKEGVIPVSESFDVCSNHVVNLYMNPLTPCIEKFNGILHPKTKSIAQHYETVNEFLFNVIQQRRKDVEEGKIFDDLLWHFMQRPNKHQMYYNDQELRDILINVIIAARDTTAVSIAYAIYMLILHPEVQSKLLLEIECCFPNEKGILESDNIIETISHMTYASAVLNETLRLFPPVPVNQREAVEDDVWPDGTIVRKGTNISWSSYSQARCSKIWGSDCKEFKPERWISDNGKSYKPAPGEWNVFNNIGARACLGERLARLEALAAILIFVQRYKIILSKPNQKIDYEVGVALKIKNGLEVLVEKRRFN